MSTADSAAAACVLVDWDNLVASAGLPINGIGLRVAASIAVLPGVVKMAADFGRAVGAQSSNLMLYGGWTMSDGRASRLADELLPSLRQNRRMIGGIAVRPSLRSTSLALNGHELLGLLRMDPPRQKMVDTILALDTVFVATHLGFPVCVVSEDDDLVPAVAEAAERTSGSPVHLLRAGRSRNYRVLESCGVRVSRPPRWA